MTPLSPVAAKTLPDTSVASAQMYLSSGSKKTFERAVGGDRIDFAVGGGSNVETALRRRHDRVHFQLGASKKVVTLPSRLIFRTLPSLPPAHSVPSAPATIDHRNGAEVSPSTDAQAEEHPAVAVDDRSSTSP